MWVLLLPFSRNGLHCVFNQKTNKPSCKQKVNVSFAKSDLFMQPKALIIYMSTPLEVIVCQLELKFGTKMENLHGIEKLK